MKVKIFLIVLILIIGIGCAGIIEKYDINNEREHNLRVGNTPGDKHPEWVDADRCTKCHMIWNWEYGYYRGWDRHGYVYDYSTSSSFGYKDPYCLDVPKNHFVDYYYTDWWRGSRLSLVEQEEPPMRLKGGYRAHSGTSTPDDFEGRVIVVDQSGAGEVASIQNAVDLAKSGDTVFVLPGTYQECVKLKPGIRLWGENPHTTIINPDFIGDAVTAAKNCEIAGFTLTGTGMNYKTYTFNSGVYALDCDSTLVIHGNIFANNGVHGILVESSKVDDTPQVPEERYIWQTLALHDLDYKGWPNPRIVGNTFYHIGERAVYSIHAAPEIANNIFIGNVKTLGMTQNARPFIHHNVFYRNNVTINMNRSMPIIRNNIMYQNYWGQRVIEGARPAIYRNVTYDSPYYKEFSENGEPIFYNPRPGTDEVNVNPKFVDPDSGDFRLADNSPLDPVSSLKERYGLVFGDGIQEPPVLPCKKSYAETFNNRNEKSDSMVEIIQAQKQRIGTVSVAYTIEYESYLDVTYNNYGDQTSVRIQTEPVSGFTYNVPVFEMDGIKRRKEYRADWFSASQSMSDSGTVVFDGEILEVHGGRFDGNETVIPDPDCVGDKVFRENYGGTYLDYDQYLNGAIGPIGTFFYGYITVFGGKVKDSTELVDGHECVVVEYPQIGADQIFRFYLDPELGYLPRKLEQYCNQLLWRRIDRYRYVMDDGVWAPIEVTITDYGIKKPIIGSMVGKTVMKVKNGTMRINDQSARL